MHIFFQISLQYHLSSLMATFRFDSWGVYKMQKNALIRMWNTMRSYYFFINKQSVLKA